MTWTRLTLDGVALTDPARGLRMQNGVRGLGMPPVDVLSEEIIGVGGDRYVASKPRARDIIIPMMVRAAGRDEWRAAMSRIRASCSTLGEVVLEVDDRRGGTLTTRVVYVEGLEGDTDLDQHGEAWSRFLIRLRAHSPYWLGPAVTEVTISNAAPHAIYPPLLPLAPAAPSFGQRYVVNAGTAKAWPVWTVTGPAASVTLTGPAGEVFTFTRPLSAGEVLVVDMDPAAQVVTVDGVSSWVSVTVDSSLWHLPPGESSVSVEMTGATEDTRASVTWQPRYWAAE